MSVNMTARSPVPIYGTTVPEAVIGIADAAEKRFDHGKIDGDDI